MQATTVKGDPSSKVAKPNIGNAVQQSGNFRERKGPSDPYVSPYVCCDFKKNKPMIHWLVCFHKCEHVLSCPIWDAIVKENRRVDDSDQVALALGEEDG